MTFISHASHNLSTLAGRGRIALGDAKHRPVQSG
jgi:hypothetical protein